MPGPALESAAGLREALSWSQTEGVRLHTPWADVNLDHNRRQRGPIIRFVALGKEAPLASPTVVHEGRDKLVLKYETEAPAPIRLTVTRQLRVERQRTGWSLVENFVLEPDRPIHEDIAIIRPFSMAGALRPADLQRGEPNCVVPLKNGWARTLALGAEPSATEYRLGHWLGGSETPELALPAVQVDVNKGWQGAICADPSFSALFAAWITPGKGGSVEGEVRYAYAGGKVPVEGRETRLFGFWIRPTPPPGEGFGRSLDTFFRLMLPEVPPGPRWLHQIYAVDYDFLSDNGHGWEQDVLALASCLKPSERRHVALCLHGWYDALGAYAFDETNHRLKERWTAMARTRKVDFSPEELRRRLRFARDRGFRALLYFGDGLAADSGVPAYHDEWAFRDEQGNKINGWQGPDTFGPTFLMNPAHPGVRRHFLGYLDALLAAVGRDVDGFVWDETFHARAGQVAAVPSPAYCDRAMMDLVKALTTRVRSFDRQKVFLASDCVGIMPGIPGYAMVASGLYQDTHCNPQRWPDALFPNWRNTYWSCNWGPVSHFDWTQIGVEAFGAPVAVSNGWGDDHGPHEWTAAERDQFLQLFQRRQARGPTQVRYLAEDPAGWLMRLKPDTAR